MTRRVFVVANVLRLNLRYSFFCYLLRILAFAEIDLSPSPSAYCHSRHECFFLSMMTANKKLNSIIGKMVTLITNDNDKCDRIGGNGKNIHGGREREREKK